MIVSKVSRRAFLRIAGIGAVGDSEAERDGETPGASSETSWSLPLRAWVEQVS